jgi:septal ring-binding cell division protein DamX
MSAPLFRLAGSGWYETDFKSDKEQKRNLAEKGDAEPAKPEAKADATTDSKAETKAVAKPASASETKSRTVVAKPAAKAAARAKPKAPARKSKPVRGKKR